MSADKHLVGLGYVAGAHGVRGALRVKLHNAQSDTLAPGVVVVLRAPAAKPGAAVERRTARIARIAPKPGSNQVRLWIEGVDGREAADALRGCEVLIDRADLPTVDDDEYYLEDLVGARVDRVDADGRELDESLGTIVGVTSNGQQDLFVVRLRGREWLLPALPDFIRAIEDTRVLVDVHDDLVDVGSER